MSLYVSDRLRMCRITAGLLKTLDVNMMARELCRQVVIVGHRKTKLKIT